MSRNSTPAALLTVLALAVSAGCSNAAAGSGGQATADQQAAAAVAVQALHDMGTNNYDDLCTIIAPGSPMLAAGIDGCSAMLEMRMMSAGQQPGVADYLSKASEFTVEASKMVVEEDSATVPMAAILYQDQPITPFGGMQEQKLIRKDGKWYLVF